MKAEMKADLVMTVRLDEQGEKLLKRLEDLESTRGIRRDTVLARLRELYYHADPEAGHQEADRLLLGLINDPEISEAFNALTRWCA